MKNKISIFLALGLLAVLFIFPGMTGAQEQKSQLYFVEEVHVKPAMAAKYEAAVKKEIELKYPHPFETYSTEDFIYYSLFPIENYGGIDKINKADLEWIGKIGKEFQALMKSAEGTIDYYKYGVVHLAPELSYAPKKPRYKPEETKFIYWYFVYLEFGKEKEFEDLCKQYADLYKSKGVSMGWNTFVAEMGVERPLYVLSMAGKSAAEFFIEDEKAMKKFDQDKIKEMGKKWTALLRKVETKVGGPRPDLSNMPKTK
jgi:hypothetical protein